MEKKKKKKKKKSLSHKWYTPADHPSLLKMKEQLKEMQVFRKYSTQISHLRKIYSQEVSLNRDALEGDFKLGKGKENKQPMLPINFSVCMNVNVKC
jgi:hypothetical protein